MGLGHALNRWLSGLMLSKPDARFSGRQERLGDLCTKADKVCCFTNRASIDDHTTRHVLAV